VKGEYLCRKIKKNLLAGVPTRARENGIGPGTASRNYGESGHDSTMDASHFGEEEIRPNEKGINHDTGKLIRKCRDGTRRKWVLSRNVRYKYCDTDTYTSTTKS
jgi:hypothetical protein